MSEKVQTVFELVDHMSHHLKELAEKAEHLKERAERVKESFERALSPTLAKVGLALGLGEMAHKLWEVREAAEQTEIALNSAYVISGRFARAGEEQFEIIRKKGEEAYSRIEEMASRGIAPTRVYADVFRSIALPALERTRATQSQIAEFAENLVPVLTGVSGSFEEAAGQARALGSALSGVGARPPRELLKVLGLTTKEWEKMAKGGPQKMFDELRERLAKVAPGMEHLFEGPGVQITRLRNSAEQLMNTLGTPVMEVLAKKAAEVVKWVQLHRKEAERIAREWGEKIAHGFDMAINAARFLAEHLKLIVGTLGVIFALPRALSATTMLAKLASATTGAVGHLAEFGKGAAKAAKGLVTFESALAAFNVGYAFGSWLDEHFGISDAIVDALNPNNPAIVWGPAGQMRVNTGAAMQDKLDAAYTAQVRASQANQKRIAHAMEVTHEEISKMPSSAEWAKGWKPEVVNNNQDFRGSKFDITQTFAEGFDPDRVATAFANQLGTLGERALQGGFGPAYGAR